jgi:hypothetical protein
VGKPVETSRDAATTAHSFKNGGRHGSCQITAYFQHYYLQAYNFQDEWNFLRSLSLLKFEFLRHFNPAANILSFLDAFRTCHSTQCPILRKFIDVLKVQRRSGWHLGTMNRLRRYVS